MRKTAFVNLFEIRSANVFPKEEKENPITGAGTGEEFAGFNDLEDLVPPGTAISDLVPSRS